MYVHVTRILIVLLMSAKSLIDQGVDLLELGVPFSDPLADGLTNQLPHSVHWSLVARRRMFSLMMEIRKFSQIPSLLHLL